MQNLTERSRTLRPGTVSICHCILNLPEAFTLAEIKRRTRYLVNVNRAKNKDALSPG